MRFGHARFQISTFNIQDFSSNLSSLPSSLRADLDFKICFEFDTLPFLNPSINHQIRRQFAFLLGNFPGWFQVSKKFIFGKFPLFPTLTWKHQFSLESFPLPFKYRNRKYLTNHFRELRDSDTSKIERP